MSFPIKTYSEKNLGVQNFLKDLLEFFICDIRTGTNDNRIKLCFYSKFQSWGGLESHLILPEWGMRTYGQSITWLPNSTTKAATCLLIPRGKMLLCLPGVVLQMSARYDADAFFHADVHQGIWVPHQGEMTQIFHLLISAYRVCTQEHQASATQLKLTKAFLLDVYSLIQLNFISWLFSSGRLGVFSLNISEYWVFSNSLVL